MRFSLRKLIGEGFCFCITTRAENGCADADDGGAFFDGDFEIAAHAHAEVREGDAENFFALDFEFTKLAEVLAGAFGVWRIRRDGHEAVDFDFGERINFGKFGEDRFGVVAELARFARDVDFEENGNGFGEFVSLAIDFLGERETIDAFDHGEEMNGVAGFVGWEMADHVPAKASGAEWNFGFGFLDFVFAKERLAGIGGGGDGVGAVAFADGEELDFGGIAIGARAGGSDAGANVLEVGADIHFVREKIMGRGRTGKTLLAK